jgi:hypothetical protein
MTDLPLWFYFELAWRTVVGFVLLVLDSVDLMMWVLAGLVAIMLWMLWQIFKAMGGCDD